MEYIHKVASDLKRIAQCEIKMEEPLSKHTSFAIGGPARLWIEPVGVDSLISSIQFLDEKEIMWIVLGNGTNVLFSDSGFDGAVISTKRISSIAVRGSSIIGGAGAGLSKVVRKAEENALTGIEFSAGIPGSLGGGVVSNAGAQGSEIGKVVSQVKVVDREMRLRSIPGPELKFCYRNCELPARSVIVEVEVELKEGNRNVIGKTVAEHLAHRREKLPLDYPSAGCVFKNPDGRSAGELIQSAGLSGMRVGRASISTKHANFIINEGGAKAQDVITLMEMIERRILEQYGIKLVREVKVIGN